MATDSNIVAAAVTETLARLFESAPSEWLRRESGVLAAVTGVPLVFFNGIWTESTAPSGRAVSELLEQVAASGLPYCAQLRPGTPRAIAEQVDSTGMEYFESIPLMVLEADDAELAEAQKVRGLKFRPVTAEEISLHTHMVAEASALDEADFSQLFNRELFSSPEVACYLGEVRGKPVTTGLALRVGENVGIFSISTPVRERGRGYGSAVTARLVADAFRAGARRAWLQSSPSGYRVYQRLGFETIECWDCWIKLAWRHHRKAG